MSYIVLALFVHFIKGISGNYDILNFLSSGYEFARQAIAEYVSTPTSQVEAKVLIWLKYS